MSFSTDLAENIRNARIKAGVSQTVLAGMLHKSTSCICQYEHANRMPNLVTIACLASVLDVAFDDLIPYIDDVQIGHDDMKDDKQTSIFDMIGE
jgi:ribosome-binding protein aMBF1 (putative translation factor)